MSIATDVRPPRKATQSSAWQQMRLIGGRNLQHVRADPEQLVNMTVFPLMFLLLFVYVFGGAIAGSSREYLQYALPGILVSSVAITSMQTAVSLNVDFQRGIVDRFRSLPISGPAVISGRVAADTVRVAWAALLILGAGMLFGFRPKGSLLGIVAALLLVAAFGIALSWLMAVLGLKAGSVEAANSLSFLVVLPLTFASSVYVDPDSMPAVLGAFARVNPITKVADGARALLMGEAAGGAVVASLIWIVLITALCAPLSVRMYRRRM